MLKIKSVDLNQMCVCGRGTFEGNPCPGIEAALANPQREHPLSNNRFRDRSKERQITKKNKVVDLTFL